VVIVLFFTCLLKYFAMFLSYYVKDFVFNNETVKIFRYVPTAPIQLW